MIRLERDGVHWLQFELLTQFKQLEHAIFLRHGGFSQGPHSSLNLSYGMGDDPEMVGQNIAQVQSLLSIDRLSSIHQVHGNSVLAITAHNWQESAPQGDAQMTTERNLGLKIVHADCQAAIFYDPVQHVVATAHAGWRGQVADIYNEVVAAMASSYGSAAADIHVGIGPSLGPAHAEFVHYRTELPSEFWPFAVEKDHFDLWALAEWQLLKAGILAPHLQIARMCTFASSEDCFSYRRQKRKTGAHGTVAMLK